jgi:hypothetical protein
LTAAGVLDGVAVPALAGPRRRGLASTPTEVADGRHWDRRRTSRPGRKSDRRRDARFPRALRDRSLLLLETRVATDAGRAGRQVPPVPCCCSAPQAVMIAARLLVEGEVKERREPRTRLGSPGAIRFRRRKRASECLDRSQADSAAGAVPQYPTPTSHPARPPRTIRVRRPPSTRRRAAGGRSA